MDENILFAGGGSQYDLKVGVAKLFALSFDERIDSVKDIVLSTNSCNTMGVSTIKRMADRDVLFVGTNQALFVVEWTGTHFYVLNIVEEIHSCKLFF